MGVHRSDLEAMQDRDLRRLVERLARAERDMRWRVDQQELALRGSGPWPGDHTLHKRLSFILHDMRRQLASARAEIVSLRPLSAAFLEQLSRPRMAAVVATSFAILALFATGAGLYGVLAYVVSRRQREYGIRSALGAAPSAIRRAVLADGLKVTAIGVVVGIGAGWMLSRTLGSVQFGVTFFDPATWLVVIAGTLVIAVLASWKPASTAMRVDPSEMLREP